MERVEIKPNSYPIELLDKEWSQRKCFFKKCDTKVFSKIHELNVRDDDVWLVTLPKCGTTWMQELVWLIMNDYDFDKAKSLDLELRTCFLEFKVMLNYDAETALSPVENFQSPRLIKTHLPLPLLPKKLWHKKPKVIYVYRNPKDAIISTYYHNRSVGDNMDKSLEEYVTWYYQTNATTLKPIDHVTEFYALRNEPWVYYTSFERMKYDLRSVIEEICKFLNKTINGEQMEQMLKHLSFEEMKNNPMVQHNLEFSEVRAKLNLPYEPHRFIRKGQANVYEESLSPECVDNLNEWINEELEKHKVTLEELLLLKGNQS